MVVVVVLVVQGANILIQNSLEFLFKALWTQLICLVFMCYLLLTKLILG